MSAKLGRGEIFNSKRGVAARSVFIRSKILSRVKRQVLGFESSMARFSSIIFALIFAVASLNVAVAQQARPVFPPARPQPPQANTQQQTPPAGVPANQQVSPIKPSPNMPLQTEQQPASNPPAMPVTPPVITYRDGLLTVQATNSTLGSVLTAIRNKTGIEFEGPEGASDHVALSLGPAPAGEVLSAIFAGSKFDFVAVGRQDNPNIVQRVIVTAKTQPGAVAGAQPQPRPNNNGEGGDEEENPDEQVNVGDPQDTAVQPVPGPQQQPQNQPQNQPQQQQPKSPEQLLQELQEMRKQQQMQQEGAPPPNPAQVPRKMPPQ